MKLVYSFNVNNNFDDNIDSFNQIIELCKISKSLYNQALYEVKDNLEKNNKFLFYNDLNKIMINKPNLESKVNYKLLKAQTSQQILRVLEKDIKSYIKSIKDYSKNPNKYKGKPKLPNYKPKNSLNQLIYTNQNCKIKDDGYLLLDKQKDIKIPIPQFDKYKDKIFDTFNQVRILPKKNNQNYFKVEIIYEIDDIDVNPNLNYDEFSSVDLGINNLLTLLLPNNNPLLYNGKQIKAVNQLFNKQLGKLNSVKDKQKEEIRIKGTTKQIKKLYEDRENEIKDLFHKLSRHVVNTLLEKGVGNIIIGYNKQWKDSIDLGNKTNQKFVQIPHRQLISYITYKCNMVGIKVKEVEESYSSRTDGLVLEHLPKYGDEITLKQFGGKRKFRGLFQSQIGKLINADVNGCINIMRKCINVVDDSYISKIIDRGFLFNPLRVRDLYCMI